MEINGREAALKTAEERSGTMASSLAQQAGDTFQIADLALTSLSRLIGADAPTQSKLALIRLDMAELLLRVPRIASLAYFEQSGWRLATSDSLAGDEFNASRSHFFRQHRKNLDTNLQIGPPLRDAQGAWYLTASRRVSHTDGSFGGVLVAQIRASYFADFYATFEASEASRVVLMSADGKLLARNPYDETQMGLDLSDTGIFKDVQNGAVFGVRRLVSPIDGVARLSAFHRVSGQPLTVIFSVTQSSAIAVWLDGLFARCAVAAILVGGVAFGGLRLATYANARVVSEAMLFELSRTDSLTGLLNRRAFDQSIQGEWLRCVGSRKPLSLLMIDVDHFKAYNDVYGHQAGDDCLRCVAKAISSSVHFPGDRIMRYGGEEFVIILPDTLPEQARLVAERVRYHVEALAISHMASSFARVTVSIGVATEVRVRGSRAHHTQLIEDADRALYSAKAGGRNRVVIFESGDRASHVVNIRSSRV